MIRLLVTGARAVTPSQALYVRFVLDKLAGPILAARRGLIVVDGECPYGGVDLVAYRWACDTPGARGERHPARWSELGSSAGPRRNAEMVALGAELCAGFPDTGSRGTWDCLKKAAEASIECRVFPLVGR